MPTSKTNALLSLAKRRQIVRPTDVAALGIPRNYLARLVRKGVLQRVGRGLYASPDFSGTENATLIEAAYRLPSGQLFGLAPWMETDRYDINAKTPQKSTFDEELDNGRTLRCTPTRFLESAPFYARYAARLGEGPDTTRSTGVGEFLDLDRFADRGIQFLLRFKTRRV